MSNFYTRTTIIVMFSLHNGNSPPRRVINSPHGMIRVSRGMLSSFFKEWQ